MLVEFVNALFTLKTTNEYLLYQGETPTGGFTKVSVMCNRAEGYNSQYFKIKQIIAEPGKQAIQQSLDLPNLESVHELIKLSLEEKGVTYGTIIRESVDNVSSTIKEVERANTDSSNDSIIPVVHAKSRSVNKIISSVPETIAAVQSRETTSVQNESSEYLGDIDGDLESFMGGGFKIANIKGHDSTNGQATAEHRNSVESLLSGDL